MDEKSFLRKAEWENARNMKHSMTGHVFVLLVWY